MTALLTDNLPLLAGSPNGIQKLRELILELAVRGKLVPQDANDEPASELLKRIAEEKARLVADGKIKKQKPLTEITPEEKPFDVPANWEWVRVAAVGHDWGQKTPTREFTYIDVGSVDNVAGVIRSPQVVAAEEAPSRARKVVTLGTVIYSTIRPYLLNVAVIGEQYEHEPIASTAFAIIHPYLGMPSRYFLWYLRSPTFVHYVESVQMGIAYPAINDGQFFTGLTPLPPITEQHRIVAKVDELMALCDRLEAQQADAKSAHAQLVQALLDSLTQASDAADFAASWQRLAEHFNTLFTTESSIDALKQTLLQLAVMGKLVQQDSNDEPASILLRHIAEQKSLLVAQGELKKQKALLDIVEEEKPFALPVGWTWSRAEEISLAVVDCPHSTPKFVSSGMLCLDTNSFKQGKLIEHRLRYVDAVTFSERNKRLTPKPGDLVFAREGSVGECIVIPEGVECCLGQRVMIFRPIAVCSEYFRLAITEPGALARLLSLHKGIGAKHVNVSDMRCALVPLPPLNEQHRIIAKVDQLMALCDQLKARLNQARQVHEHLANALVEQAVA